MSEIYADATDCLGPCACRRGSAHHGWFRTLARRLWRADRIASGGEAPDCPVDLRGLVVGECGRVRGFAEGGRGYRRKLLAMGMTPGVEFQVLRVAPLGDPVEVRVRGSHLSLRKDEAARLQVERLGRGQGHGYGRGRRHRGGWS
jgi:ferrous iron transport protein A